MRTSAADRCGVRVPPQRTWLLACHVTESLLDTPRVRCATLAGVNQPAPVVGSIDPEVEETLRTAGATDADFYRMSSTELAAELSVRPPGEVLSWAELLEASSCSEDEAIELMEAVGLPAGSDTHPWFSSDTMMLEMSTRTSAVLGRTAVLALMRRTGIAASQLATASSGSFRVSHVAESAESSELERVKRNLVATSLVNRYVLLLQQVIRHHYLLAFRNDVVPVGDHGELRTLAIGFVDLASSSSISSQLSASQLSAAITSFEAASTRAAVRHGVRVVKTIGDEVMLSASSVDDVCGAALDLVDWVAGHDVFISARAGVAIGSVLEQDGDCYGPVVNTAARLGEAADDGAVMATETAGRLLAGDLHFSEQPIRDHRGIGPVSWGRVTRIRS
jgi:class 3 adenylate cyclase